MRQAESASRTMRTTYRQTIERTGSGWSVVGDPDRAVYASLQEAWDEARHDLLHVGGGRIEVVDRRGRVRACETIAVQDLGHTG